MFCEERNDKGNRYVRLWHENNVRCQAVLRRKEESGVNIASNLL